MTSNVYDKAREILKEQGRCTGRFADQDERVCLIGAVLHADGMTLKELQAPEEPDSLFNRPVLGPVRDVILAQYPELDRLHPDENYSPGDVVYRFNDFKARCDDEAVDLVLDKAARAYDEQVRP